MDKVLLATDSDETAEETFAALLGPKTSVSRVTRGEDVREVAAELEPDLVILAVNTFVKVCENFNTKYLDFIFYIRTHRIQIRS